MFWQKNQNKTKTNKQNKDKKSRKYSTDKSRDIIINWKCRVPELLWSKVSIWESQKNKD